MNQEKIKKLNSKIWKYSIFFIIIMSILSLLFLYLVWEQKNQISYYYKDCNYVNVTLKDQHLNSEGNLIVNLKIGNKKQDFKFNEKTLLKYDLEDDLRARFCIYKKTNETAIIYLGK